MNEEAWKVAVQQIIARLYSIQLKYQINIKETVKKIKSNRDLDMNTYIRIIKSFNATNPKNYPIRFIRPNGDEKTHIKIEHRLKMDEDLKNLFSEHEISQDLKEIMALKKKLADLIQQIQLTTLEDDEAIFLYFKSNLIIFDEYLNENMVRNIISQIKQWVPTTLEYDLLKTNLFWLFPKRIKISGINENYRQQVLAYEKKIRPQRDMYPQAVLDNLALLLGNVFSSYEKDIPKYVYLLDWSIDYSPEYVFPYMTKLKLHEENIIRMGREEEKELRMKIHYLAPIKVMQAVALHCSVDALDLVNRILNTLRTLLINDIKNNNDLWISIANDTDSLYHKIPRGSEDRELLDLFSILIRRLSIGG